MIPYGRQSIDDADIAAVVEVLRSDWLTQGPAVERFESDLCRLTGARHAVAFANGTAALHAALAAGGVGPGQVVATSALSFAASAQCARYVGATPQLVDVIPQTLNIDLSAVPTYADAVVAVHYAGLPADLSALRGHRPHLVVEDAAQALGAVTEDGPVGNCASSDMCTFSFHPVKTVTTAEGGAVTTNSDPLADRLRRFRNHGIVRRPEQGAWYYEIPELGFNYRLSDVHAALGVSQLVKLDEFVARRTALAARYRSLLADLPVTLPAEAPAGWRHAYHLFPIRVADRDRLFDQLRAAGIGVQVHHVPLYRHPVLRGPGNEPERFPATEAAYRNLLSLPLFPALTEADQDRVVETLAGLL